jgi:phenylalanyl-tRNA synthetase beta subunit
MPSGNRRRSINEDLIGSTTRRALCPAAAEIISNAVDATNYVTLAMGHPTHAFDRDKLEGGIAAW